MTSQVFFGSARQARLEAKETLPAKLDLILDRLHLRDRVKDETVAIKMHTGNNIGYLTVHPVFVRKIVRSVKDGGGKLFVTDVSTFTRTPFLQYHPQQFWVKWQAFMRESLKCQVPAGPLAHQSETRDGWNDWTAETVELLRRMILLR